MQFIKDSRGFYHARTLDGAVTYEIEPVTGAYRYVARALTPTGLGGYAQGYIGSYRKLTEAKSAVRYAESMRTKGDPNGPRKNYLEAEIKEAIEMLVKSTLAVEKAKTAMQHDLDRLARLQKELSGLKALDAREDDHEAQQAAQA